MHSKKQICVLGGNGFIGSHMAKRLKSEGHFVGVVDIKHPTFSPVESDVSFIGDLRNQEFCKKVFASHQWDEIYQYAADMGGAGYIFSGENDANVMHNSSLINLNVAENCVVYGVKKVCYTSSACIYSAHNQEDPENPNCKESSAYPAAPDSEYGWEKLFSERLYLSFMRNYGLQVRITRFHNIFGPDSVYEGGKEKSPAALCRKVIMTPDNGTMEVWGPGNQTRSFLYIDECIEGTRRLMDSDFPGPVNIGSEEKISINDLAKMAIKISGKNISIKNVPGPIGVMGRVSDNELIQEKLGWKPSAPLIDGMTKTYKWIEQQIQSRKIVERG
jgi:nucleoside-diphosphate-sugar epimerase